MVVKQHSNRICTTIAEFEVLDNNFVFARCTSDDSFVPYAKAWFEMHALIGSNYRNLTISFLTDFLDIFDALIANLLNCQKLSAFFSRE